MRIQKALAALLAVPMVLTGIAPEAAIHLTSTKTFTAAAAETTSAAAYPYFYDQLPADAVPFYDAMCDMYQQGIFKTGNQDFDLTANGYLTQEQAAAYAGGGSNVLYLYGAARDAFYMDNADLFYVDLEKLSIRVTSDGDNYHVYIGTGRTDTYYADGFTNAEQVENNIAAFDDAVDQLAESARHVTVPDGKSLTAEQVRYVHDYITHHTAYRLENACKPENLGLIRTAYGPLVAGEGVCEGYSRALKAVLDELNIPCVLVNGVYRHTEESQELHMWTDVQVDGVWYGTDVTMDDPVTKVTDHGLDGYENDELLLAGDSVMSRRHGESGIISDANFEFAYPALALDSYGEVTTHYSNGLTVRFRQDGEFEDIPAGEFYVSYQGMGYAKAAEQGKYMVCNMSNYYENTDEWDNSGWCYITPELYPALVDSDTELYLPLSNVQNIQFGITDIPYGTTEYNGYEIPDLYYHGDPFLLEASTEILHNPNGNYIAPPYPSSVSPVLTSKLRVGTTYHVVATYDDALVRTEGTEPGVCFSYMSGTTAAEYAQLSNFSWDGDRTITFDFKPSEMWADDDSMYSIAIQGLVGARSLKAPNEISYRAAAPCAVCCYRMQGYDWNVFGQPSLIDNSDISTNDWKTSDGTPVDEMLKHRMVLVASTPSHSQTDAMNEMIDTETDETVLKTETYNISLSVCKQMVVQTGQGVRVSLGFPQGYGPEDEGVTFKVYHFMRNDAGELTGVEEIPCVVTKYGLIVTCDSFSPYAVAVVEKDETQVSAKKSLVMTHTSGGTVSGAESIAALQKGESLTLHLQAEDGYVIDTVSVNGTYAEITNGDSMMLEIGYDDIAGNTGIVDVKFTARSVLEKEAERGETAIPVDAEANQQEEQPAVTTEETTDTTTTETKATTTTAKTTTTTGTVATTTATTAGTAAAVSTTVIAGEDGEASRVIAVDADGVTDVYLLYAIDSLHYAKAGFVVQSDGKEAVWETDTVFESVDIEGKTYTAEEFGGTYLVALRLTDVPEDAAANTTAVPAMTEAAATTDAALPEKAVVMADEEEEEIA